MMNIWGDERPWWEEEEEEDMLNTRIDGLERKFEKFTVMQKKLETKMEDRFERIERMMRDLHRTYRMAWSNTNGKAVDYTPQNHVSVEFQSDESGDAGDEVAASFVMDTELPKMLEEGAERVEEKDEEIRASMLIVCKGANSALIDEEDGALMSSTLMKEEGDFLVKEEEASKRIVADVGDGAAMSVVGEKVLVQDAMRAYNWAINYARADYEIGGIIWVGPETRLNVWSNDWDKDGFFGLLNIKGPDACEFSLVERKFTFHHSMPLVLQKWMENQTKIAATVVTLQSRDDDRAPAKPPWAMVSVIRFPFYFLKFNPLNINCRTPYENQEIMVIGVGGDEARILRNIEACEWLVNYLRNLEADVPGLYNIAMAIIGYRDHRVVMQSVSPGTLQSNQSDSKLNGYVDYDKRNCWNEEHDSKLLAAVSIKVLIITSVLIGPLDFNLEDKGRVLGGGIVRPLIRKGYVCSAKRCLETATVESLEEDRAKGNAGIAHQLGTSQTGGSIR